ncbi:ORF.64 [Pseudomonas phage PaP3]|uniref:ORF.64 n=1 Tax=Pseudomonas phage PaP3 TaxID=2905964 RepID=Q8H9X8_9CAUD|nr:ORF.64 [Pseudomonas phage PaP3]AAL85508.1 ORF.64 [Pseudomonas phage PaP3]
MNGFSFAAIILSGLAIGWVIGATTVVRKDAPVAVSKGEVIGETASMSLYRFYDREEGAVCYSTSRGLSCLRLVKTP